MRAERIEPAIELERASPAPEVDTDVDADEDADRENAVERSRAAINREARGETGTPTERARRTNTPHVPSARFDGDPELDRIEAGTATVKEGDHGPVVTKLQSALVDLGYLSRRRVDGDFGTKTAKALKNFQAAAGVAVTGELDQATLAAMQARFDTRKAYVRAGKYDNDNPGTRSLEDYEKLEALDAMVPERAAKSAPPFVEVVNGQKYGDRIHQRLLAIVPALHKGAYADREALRVDPDNLHDDSTLEGPAAAAKKVTDKVYSGYAGGGARAPTFANGGLVDVWDKVSAEARGLNVDEKRGWAREVLNYQITNECEDINLEHNAIVGRADEKAILDPILDAWTMTPHVVEQLIQIDIGWGGMQFDGQIGVQRFKAADQDANRAEMWDLFHTCIHEYLHLVKHPDYEKAADDWYAAGDYTRYHTMIEGFCDFFTLNVRAALTIDKRLQRHVEGPYYDRSKAPPAIDPGLYSAHADAERVVAVVGIKNAQAAYFLGDTDKIGLR